MYYFEQDTVPTVHTHIQLIFEDHLVGGLMRSPERGVPPTGLVYRFPGHGVLCPEDRTAFSPVDSLSVKFALVNDQAVKLFIVEAKRGPFRFTGSHILPSLLRQI